LIAILHRPNRNDGKSGKKKRQEEGIHRGPKHFQLQCKGKISLLLQKKGGKGEGKTDRGSSDERGVVSGLKGGRWEGALRGSGNWGVKESEAEGRNRETANRPETREFKRG